MAETGYWTNVLARRITRRRALAGVAALSAGAALLAACGGDGDGSDGGKGGVLKQQPDRTKEAKVGGTFRLYGGGITSVDQIGTSSTPNRDGAAMLHNRLLQVLPGVNKPSSGEKVGDAASSWEVSPDGLKLTFKIRPNLGTDPRPPVNGRKLDAQDVLSSWKRWSAESTLKGDMLNSANPDAPVLSASSPDNNTFVLDLAAPSSLLLDQLTDGFYFWVMPREANDRVYDPNIQQHGAGPYYLEELVPGAHTKMVRNPNYYDSPIPYYERMEWFAIPERSVQTAQFEAKQIDLGRGVPNVSGPVDNDNVLIISGRRPEALLYATPLYEVGPTSRFGLKEGSPFRDERIRQAISMMNDRAALTEVFTNETKLKAAGIPANSRWATHISAMWDYVWEDPKDSKALQGNAKYFQYNLAEAKKLLEAVGKLNYEFVYHVDNYNPINLPIGDTLSSHLQNSGLVRPNQKVEDFASWSIPNVYRGRGDYEGMFHGAIAYKFSPELFIFSHMHPGPGTAFYNAAIGESLFPDIVRMVKAMLKELDSKKRVQLIKDIQVLAAKQMPWLPTGAVDQHYTLAWPWVAQAAVLQEWPGDGVAYKSPLYSRFWFDASKKS